MEKKLRRIFEMINLVINRYSVLVIFQLKKVKMSHGRCWAFEDIFPMNKTINFEFRIFEQSDYWEIKLIPAVFSSSIKTHSMANRIVFKYCVHQKISISNSRSVEWLIFWGNVCIDPLIARIKFHHSERLCTIILTMCHSERGSAIVYFQ